MPLDVITYAIILSMDRKYTLVMNETQMKLIARALDLHSRVQMGEITAVMKALEGTECLWNRVSAVEGGLKDVEHIIRPEGGYMGIHHPLLVDDARVAYDLIQVLKHEEAIQKHATDSLPAAGCNVWLNEPRVTSTIGVPLATVTSEMIESSQV